MNSGSPVGVFDSGVGGLSVLSALTAILPHEDYIYLSDAANAPYGNKTHEQVASLSLKNTETLLSLGCKAIVVACNTATAAAVDLLRSSFPDIVIIGIEPALKPAFAAGCRRVAVLATPRTVSEDRLKTLISRLSREFGAEARGIGCAGLAGMIERRSVTDTYFDDLFEREGVKNGFDGIVLGCTHYSFVADMIRRVSGGLPVFDGAEGTARQTKKMLQSQGLLNLKTEKGSVGFTGDAEGAARFWEDVALKHFPRI